MPSLTHRMIACQLSRLGRQIETAVCCYCRGKTICCVLSLKSDLKRILPRHDDCSVFSMEPKASADLLNCFTSIMTHDGIWSEGWKMEGEQQSTWRFVTGEFQGTYSL